MNIYIPSYFIFNVAMFILALFALKIVRFGQILKPLQDKKVIVFLLLSFLLILFMIAPLISLRLYDFSAEKGELFPAVRIIQKNDGVFKRILATEIYEPIMSSRFTNNLGTYCSYYNIFSLIYPGLSNSFFTQRGFTPGQISEMFQYIGILPFLLCIIGLFYNKTRYRYLASMLLLLISINMVTFHHSIISSPNFIQNIFNGLFPLLKSIEVRQNFSPFFLLYMCMLLSMGLQIFFNSNDFWNLIKRKYNLIVNICLLVFLIQLFISKYIYRNPFLNSSVDLCAMFILVSASIYFYLYGRGYIKKNLFYKLILFFILIDLIPYNYSLKNYVLQPNELDYELSVHRNQAAVGDFEYFRRPFVKMDKLYGRLDLAFAETMLGFKGAMSKGHNHHLYTTRRYYDFFTYVPLENQFLLSGVIHPIIGFYEEERVKWLDKKDILQLFMKSNNDDRLVQNLFLENVRDKVTKDTEPAEFLGIDEFEDARDIKASNIESYYADFMMKNGEQLQEIKENVYQYLERPEYTLVVKDFSPNELKLSVNNQKGGYLYYNDGWSKYWRAYDGDKIIPINIANYNFKSIFLEKGEHSIRFIFDPYHYRFALILYHLGLIFSLFIVIILFIRLKLSYGKI